MTRPQHAPIMQRRDALKEAKNEYWDMRQAADVEDRNDKHLVTPGRIVPAREPNRFRGLHGAARTWLAERLWRSPWPFFW